MRKRLDVVASLAEERAEGGLEREDLALLGSELDLVVRGEETRGRSVVERTVNLGEKGVTRVGRDVVERGGGKD